MSRAAVVFPGRGSYLPASLGSLAGSHAWVERADQIRAELGLEPLLALDAAKRFDPSVHLRPSNAWPLTFVASLLDAERIAEDHDVVVVTASSTGWYTALAAAGVLDFDAAVRLVHRLARVAEESLEDGPAAELVYPLTDEAWRADPSRNDALDGALDEATGAYRAIELGAYAVIGGSATGVERVATALEPIDVAGRRYPLRMPAGDAWHTPLRADHVAAATGELTGLGWDRPNVALIDGRGVRHTPWAAEPTELARHTLSEQPSTPYDTATAVRVALREYAPEVVLLPGPGASLGATCAHVIVSEGYRGIRSRAEFEAAQRSDRPVLLSMRR